jgi:hypothetical protein
MAQTSEATARRWAEKALAACERLPDRILAAVEGWRERFLLAQELAELSRRGELERTLVDSGIAPCEVARLLHAHPGSPRQLARMMQRLGIDRARLPCAALESVREMEWRCGDCTEWRHCREWLASAAPAESHHAFCPNAEALDRLRVAGESAAGERSER